MLPAAGRGCGTTTGSGPQDKDRHRTRTAAEDQVLFSPRCKSSTKVSITAWWLSGPQELLFWELGEQSTSRTAEPCLRHMVEAWDMHLAHFFGLVSMKTLKSLQGTCKCSLHTRWRGSRGPQRNFALRRRTLEKYGTYCTVVIPGALRSLHMQ